MLPPDLENLNPVHPRYLFVQLQIELLQNNESSQDVSIANTSATMTNNTSANIISNSTTCEADLSDDTDHIDAALNQLEKMLNEGGLSSSGPDTGHDDAAVDDFNDGDDGAFNHAAVDCTQIPRLTAQLSYVRSECNFC